MRLDEWSAMDDDITKHWAAANGRYQEVSNTKVEVNRIRLRVQP